jgi:hypothetical protein
VTALRPVSSEQGRVQKIPTSRATLLVLLIFLPFLVQAVTYLKLLFQYIFVQNDTAYPEGASVYAFLMALRTGSLYSQPFQFPLNVELYGPVFYLVGVILAKVAHGDPLLTTELERTLSLLSFLGSIGLVGYLSWRLERVKHWTAVSIALALACTWSIPYVASARPESLSMLFIFGALTVYEVAQGRSKIVFWAGMLGALAFLTKQSTAPVLFALVIDSLIARRFRNIVALVGGGLPIPALLLFVLWFRHEPFLANFDAIGHALRSWPTALSTALNCLRTNQAAIIPICVALLGTVLNWRKVKYRAILLAAGFGCFANLAALSNLGGYAHYLILPWLLMIPMIPAGLIQIEQWTRRSILIPVGLTLLGVILLVHQRNLLIRKLPADIDTSTVGRLEILSDLPYLEMRSREPQLMDPFFYHDLSLQNLWSFAPIAQRIDNEEYDLVLINGENGRADSDFSVTSFRGISYWGTDALGTIESHYRVLCEVPEFLALVPLDRPNTVKEQEIGRIFRQPCSATTRRPQLDPGVR